MRTFDFLLRSNWIFPLSRLAVKERKAVKILHDFTDSVILARRKELLESQKSSKTQNDDKDEAMGMKKKLALLDVLLQSTIEGEPLSNRDIREEVDTFMFEGHDTTTSGISFILYLIAKHPEVQKKLIEEIREVIGNDTTKPLTQQMLNNLHYLDVVIKESLRLYPSVPIYARKMTEDTKISKFNMKIN